jgi:regulatory protein
MSMSPELSSSEDLQARISAARDEMVAESRALPADDGTRQRALGRCSVVLSYRACTEHELREKLRASEFEPDVVDWAISKCIESRLIDDLRYATSFLASRLRRGHGLMRIRNDLNKRGIARPLVDEAWQVHQDEHELEHGEGTARHLTAAAAERALAKKFDAAGLVEQAARAKATRFLAGRGFNYGEIEAALRAVRAGGES